VVGTKAILVPIFLGCGKLCDRHDLRDIEIGWEDEHEEDEKSWVNEGKEEEEEVKALRRGECETEWSFSWSV
jgi:hypothetical protein